MTGPRLLEWILEMASFSDLSSDTDQTSIRLIPIDNMTEWQRVLRWMQRRVNAHDDAMRIDRWLRRQFPRVPHSFLQRQLRQRKIRLLTAEVTTSIPAKPQSLVHAGAIVAIDAVVFEQTLRDTMAESDPMPTSLSPAMQVTVDDLVQRIVYDDPNFLVLNKPHGLAVQDGTALRQSLTSYLPALGAAMGTSEPPRLVHRLDKETSGLLVLARHRLAAAQFATLLRDGAIHKTYDALVAPLPQAPGIPRVGEITLAINEKSATTRFCRIRDGDDAGTVWLEMQPITGRKHQLRIHCAHGLHAPIVGDRKYAPSRRPPSNRLYLHAKRVTFPDPFRPGRRIDVTRLMDLEDKLQKP